jgi:hypothetical protein
LEFLRGSKRQKQEERKEYKDREREARAEAAEVRRLKIATARARMPKHRRSIKKFGYSTANMEKGCKKECNQESKKCNVHDLADYGVY